MKFLYLIPILLLAACAQVPQYTITEPRVLTDVAYTSDPPERGAIVAAVYSYGDLTGQRAPRENIASLSTAVTQGGENYLIDALMEYSDGTWFRVVERAAIENLVRERQIIRSSRTDVDSDISALPPMLYAGVLIEGGIIGYDTNVISGGNAIRTFGLGVQESYTEHTVTVALRVVSVATSEVVLTVIVQKNVLSVSQNGTGFRFFDLDRELLEFETGTTQNEAPSIAVKMAIETAVHELVQEGLEKEIW